MTCNAINLSRRTRAFRPSFVIPHDWPMSYADYLATSQIRILISLSKVLRNLGCFIPECCSHVIFLAGHASLAFGLLGFRRGWKWNRGKPDSCHHSPSSLFSFLSGQPSSLFNSHLFSIQVIFSFFSFWPTLVQRALRPLMDPLSMSMCGRFD